MYGREAECARLDSVITGLGVASGTSLLLTGEPGIGKTALLQYAMDSAASVRVLAARGVRAEASLPFSGLHELLQPVLDLLPHIPARQADALAAGLALSAATDVDQLAVAAGTLSLLAAAAEDRPVLVLVDNVELLDPTSREAVLFTARRAADRVGMVLSMSVEDDDGALPCHRVAPLDVAAGMDLLCATGDTTVPLAVAERLVAATAGSPLALLEAPSVLTPDQLTGVEPLPNPVPVGPLVLRAFAPRLTVLTAERRFALLVAAAAGEAELSQVLAALRILDLPPETLTGTECQDLVALVGDGLEFRHPLMRAVAYHQAAVAQRRAAHDALARVAPPARRAWHLGAATLAPDERAGDELEQAAAGHERLAAGEAARLMERAAELTTTSGVRARRCVAAAELWQLAGAAYRVRGLLDKASRLTTDLRVRAHAQAVLGQTECRGGRPVRARRLLAREAARVHGTDPASAVAMLLDAAEAGCLADEPRAALVAVHRAGLLARRAPQPLPAVLAGEHAAVLARCGRLTEARVLLAGCRTELEQVALDGALPTGWRWTMRAGYPALLTRLGEFDAAWRVLDVVIAHARQREVTGLLPGLLVEQAEVSTHTGDWDGAHAAATEAVELAERIDQSVDLAAALVCLARLAAARGRRAECLSLLGRARRLARCGRLDGLAVAMGAVEGLLELGAGEYEAAYVLLERIAAKVEAGGAADYGRVPWAADLVESAVRLGQPGRARRLLADAERHTAGSSVLAAVLTRCAALLSADRSEELFLEALHADPRGTEPFEQARTQLCLAEWLRGHDRCDEAAVRAASAFAVFDELGAQPWIERARRAAGTVAADPALPEPVDEGRPHHPLPSARPDEPGRPRPAGTAPCEPLTAQERRVCVLVGQGATNREAARALYLSPKTIEFHLRGVYRKLGVRSRAELAHLVGREDLVAVDGTPRGLSTSA